jgi:hypothetical protein
VAPIIHGRYDRGGDHWTNSRQLRESSTHLVCATDGDDLLIELFDSAIELAQLVQEFVEDLPRQIRQVGVCDRDWCLQGKAPRALRQDAS